MYVDHIRLKTLPVYLISVPRAYMCPVGPTFISDQFLAICYCKKQVQCLKETHRWKS